MADEIKFIITADSKGAVKSIKKAETSLKKLEGAEKKAGTAAEKTAGQNKKLKKSMDDAEKSAGKFNLKMVAVGGALLAVGQKILQAVPELVNMGQGYDRATVALGAFVGGSGAAESAIRAVQDAAGGSISKLDAATNATRLFSMGLASTASEAAELTNIAVTLGATMGKGPQEAFEEFTLLLANQSILRLDTYGISAGKVRTRMAELAKSEKDAGREANFMAATMEIARQKMGLLDEAGFEATSSIDEARATFEDAKVAAGSLLVEAIEPLAEAFVENANNVDILKQALATGIITQNEYNSAMNRSGVGANSFRNVVGRATEGLSAHNAMLERARGATDSWKVAMDNAGREAGELERATTNVGIAIGNLSTAALGAKAMDLLTTAFKKGDIELDDYKRQASKVMEQLLGMDATAIQTALSLFEIEQSLEDGVDVGAAVDDIGELAEAAEQAAGNYKITFDVSLTGADIPGLDEGVDFDPTDKGSAHGGVTFAGGATITGEEGPEIFHPGRLGSIESNARTHGSNRPAQGATTNVQNNTFTGDIVAGEGDKLFDILDVDVQGF